MVQFFEGKECLGLEKEGHRELWTLEWQRSSQFAHDSHAQVFNGGKLSCVILSNVWMSAVILLRYYVKENIFVDHDFREMWWLLKEPLS